MRYLLPEECLVLRTAHISLKGNRSHPETALTRGGEEGGKRTCVAGDVHSVLLSPLNRISLKSKIDRFI